MSRSDGKGWTVVFGWPLVIALFWEGRVDAFAGVLLAAPVVATVLARWKRAA